MIEKTAILIDSGTDVPERLIHEYNMFVLPLRLLFNEGEFIDKVTINEEQLYEKMKTEIPKTSLPSGEDITTALEKIKGAGYTHVIGICISSGLSGTFNAIRLAADAFEGLTIEVIDTKSISIGSGFLAIEAARLLQAGEPFAHVVEKTRNAVGTTNVFFTVATLENLKKGGRIGLVAGTVAELMNIKPVISCNPQGVYYTVAKVRGRRKSLAVLIEKATQYLEGQKYRLCIVQANAKDEFEAFQEQVRKALPQAIEFFAISISPSLAVHTGENALGIGVQIITS